MRMNCSPDDTCSSYAAKGLRLDTIYDYSTTVLGGSLSTT